MADAIEREDAAGLQDELGDLLFQVAFHSQMASEAGWFDFGDVLEGICEKMVRRHPHVFAGETIESRITSYNVCYTKLLRAGDVANGWVRNTATADSDETSSVDSNTVEIAAP